MKKTIMDARDAADLEGRPTPVIRSDLHTITILVGALAKEIGCRIGDFRTLDHPTAKFIFDGVKFEIG